MPRINWTREAVLYAGLVGLLLLPLWTNAYFVTQDGPMHLHNARILLDHWTSRGLEHYREYYVPNIHLFPYWIGHLSLAALLTIVGPATAEKIFLTVYIVLFAYGLRRLLRAINPRGIDLSFLGLPLICNRSVQMGFFEFSASLVVLVFVMLVYFRRDEVLRWRGAAALSLLLLLLYFCHPTTYLLAVGGLACLLLTASIRELRDAAEIQSALRRITIEAGTLAVAALPSALLMTTFLRGAPNYAIAAPTSYWTLLGNFLDQSNLAMLSRIESSIVLVIPLVFAIVGFALVRERRRRFRVERSDGFFLAAIVALAMHLYGSMHMIGFFERMQFVPLLMLLPWLAARPPARDLRRIVIGASTVIVVTLVALRYPRQAMASSIAEEYTSAISAIDERSTVLALSYDLYGRTADGGQISEFVPLFLHVPEYLGASGRSLIMLNNIGGLYPMFPYLWRADRNPFRYLATDEGIESDPPSAEFLSYAPRTGAKVEYVVTLRLGVSRFSSHSHTLRTQQQLKQAYRSVFTSTNRQVVVYKSSQSK